MGVFSFGAKLLNINKKGVKKTLEIHKKSEQNRMIEEGYEKAEPGFKKILDNKYLKNKSDIHKLVKDKDVKKVIKKLDERNKLGKKEAGSYIQKKLKDKETSKFKKGKFVQVKTKLGRNRPTKLY